MTRRWMAAVVLLALCVASVAQAQSYVWWEGERPVATNFPERSGFSPQNDQESAVLSGGQWLSVDGERDEPLYADYEIDVPAAGRYDLWVRKFWKHGPFRYRFDEGAWTNVGKDVVLADSETLRPLVGANWVHLEPVELSAGRHRFRIELTENRGAACFDAFLLTSEPFTPRGKLRPGQKYDRAPEGWFPFEPDRDSFAQTPLDLRGLNEPQAGGRGWVLRRGKDLVFQATGEPVRFWGVTATHSIWRMDHAEVDYLARRLAKMGVNLVRLHASPFHELEPGRDTDSIQYLVAALKREGIYVGINWYCLAGVRNQPAWNLPELPDGYRPMAAVFTYEPLQQRYKQWAHTLFATPNPYTGIPLGQDPAVAFIELIDEDNYFFWTFRPADMPEPVLASLQRAFGDWLTDKYGSLEKARSAWGDGPLPQGNADDFAAGRVALYYVGNLTGADWARAARNEPRARDQLQFLTENQRDFWAGMRQWLREEIGFGGIVVATNWKTADERVLGPLDKYTYLAGDATARNCYFSGPNVKTGTHGHGAEPGDLYEDQSVLRTPDAAVMLEIQYADYPHLLTEGGWAMPNRFRTEGPVLSAAYGALQGTDAFLPFVLERNWTGTIAKWPIQTPATFGQYPATALIFRRGYVREGPVAIDERLDLDALYRFEGAAMSQPLGLDSYRLQEVPDGQQVPVEDLGGMDPLAFYVGRVIRTIGDDPGPTRVLKELPTLIDRQGQRVRSATGELVYDFGQGIATIDTPCAQGVTGFLAEAGPVELTDVRIEPGNEYGSVLLVSLDGAPLAQSGRMLLQVMSEEQNFGWQTTEVQHEDKQGQVRTMQRIDDAGQPPVVVRDLAGVVTLQRPDAARLTVTALDANGYPQQALDAGRDGQVRVELLPECLYYLIERPTDEAMD